VIQLLREERGFKFCCNRWKIDSETLFVQCLAVVIFSNLVLLKTCFKSHIEYLNHIQLHRVPIYLSLSACLAEKEGGFEIEEGK